MGKNSVLYLDLSLSLRVCASLRSQSSEVLLLYAGGGMVFGCCRFLPAFVATLLYFAPLRLVPFVYTFYFTFARCTLLPLHFIFVLLALPLPTRCNTWTTSHFVAFAFAFALWGGFDLGFLSLSGMVSLFFFSFSIFLFAFV